MTQPAVIAQAVERVKTTPKITEIFVASLKKGPVRRDIEFRAVDQEDAQRIFTKYVNWLNGREIAKVMQVGQVKPLALDLEDEIVKERTPW